jgi:hypothetical protein
MRRLTTGRAARRRFMSVWMWLSFVKYSVNEL